MDTKDIKSQYKEMLAFHYGDTDKLIAALKHGIEMYNTCGYPNDKRCVERRALYYKIIEYANKQKI